MILGKNFRFIVVQVLVLVDLLASVWPLEFLGLKLFVRPELEKIFSENVSIKMLSEQFV